MASFKKWQSLSALVLALLTATCVALPARSAERPSLKALALKLQKGPEITQAFSKKQNDKNSANSVASLLTMNQALREEFALSVKDSAAFARGEIEDEKILNFVTNLLQLSILEIRSDFAKGASVKAGDETLMWFNFAADLSYEESSLVGLRLSSLIRSLLLDELERASHETPTAMSQAGVWLKKLRVAWPVDRVFLYESRRVLKPQSLAVAEKVAKAFQKNAYQTAEQILKKTPGGAGPDLEFLKSIWRESDLNAMKTEVNRLALLKVRAADLQFEENKKAKASDWNDLKTSGGLEAVPVDYFTGRPMEWAQALATRTATSQATPSKH